MLKNEIFGELNVRLKKGTVLPIDGVNVQYNECHNWSNDTHVLDTVDYVGHLYNLTDKEGNTIEVDALEYVGEGTANIIAFKDNNEVVIKTNNGDIIEGYKIGSIYPNEKISLFGSDERHSKENDYQGSPLDINVNIDTLTEYFEII